MPKTSTKQTIFSAQDFRPSVSPWFINSFKHKSGYTNKRKQKELKKVWVQKKVFLEPRKMKQVWIIKATSTKSEVLKTKEVRKMIQNLKPHKKKRKVKKTHQRYYPVSISEPNLIWVPKIFC